MAEKGYTIPLHSCCEKQEILTVILRGSLIALRFFLEIHDTSFFTKNLAYNEGDELESGDER